MISLTLPFPPSLNTYYRHVVIPVKSGKGRSVTLMSMAGRKYREAVKNIATGACACMSGPLRVCLELYPPDRRARDLDNYAKAVLDALTHAGVWGDDSQMDELHIYRRGIKRGGELVATIEVMEDAR